MSGFEGLTLCLHSVRLTLLGLASSLRTLLTETNQLNLIAFFGENSMTLRLVIGSSLRLVVAGKCFATALDSRA